MIDGHGDVRPELAGDHVVKGRRPVDGSTDRNQVAADRVDAFTNAAPRA
jgi:hypothetical protein